jgi:hypothetical protein
MSFEYKLKSIYESSGREATLNALSDAIAEKKIDASHSWSLRRLFEAFHGHDWAEQFQTRRILEGPEAVSLSNAAAVGVTGQLLLSIIKDAYNLQKTIANDLCTTIGVTNQNLGPEVSAYISSPQVGGIDQEVIEGATFPANLVATQSVTLPRIFKWGSLLNLSYESIAGDKTGQIIKQAQMIGQMVKLNETYNILNTVLGYAQTYIFNGNSLNTYYTASTPNAPFVNKITGFSIDSLQSFNLLEQTILNQVDPYSGQPIELLDRKQVLVVPQSLYKVRSIINANEVRYGNYDPSGDRFQTFSENPLVSSEYQILSDIYTQRVLSQNGMSYADAANFMLFGNIAGAFMNRVFRPLELTTLPQPSTYNITNDVLMTARAVMMSSCGVYDPRKVALGVVS